MQPAYTPHWSQMSADGRDHHPLFSLGAVVRVHTDQKSVSPSTHPPLIRTRRPVRMTLGVFYAGGGHRGFPLSVSHWLKDNN